MKKILIIISLILFSVLCYSQTTITKSKVLLDSLKARNDSIYLRSPISSKNIIKIKGDTVTTNKVLRTYIGSLNLGSGSGLAYYGNYSAVSTNPALFNQNLQFPNITPLSYMDNNFCSFNGKIGAITYSNNALLGVSYSASGVFGYSYIGNGGTFQTASKDTSKILVLEHSNAIGTTNVLTVDSAGNVIIQGNYYSKGILIGSSVSGPNVGINFSGSVDLSNPYYTSYNDYTISTGGFIFTFGATKVNGSSAQLVIKGDGTSTDLPSLVGTGVILVGATSITSTNFNTSSGAPNVFTFIRGQNNTFCIISNGTAQ